VFINYLEKDYENWIIYWEKNEIIFKPIKIDNYSNDLIFKYADICILMSGTILNDKSLTNWLGIDDDEYIFIKVKSPFKAEKRPIIYDLVGKMSYKFKENTMPKTIPKIKEILDKHPNDKGIIHTNSYEFQEYISSNINNKRILTHKSNEKELIIDKFKKSDSNHVLVSPSLGEGVDLPYDNCKFQIIYKIPFPHLGDPQIKKRMSFDSDWYNYKTVVNLVQEYGRIMRAEDDFGITYITDSSVDNLENLSYAEIVPEFFKEAIVNNSSIEISNKNYPNKNRPNIQVKWFSDNFNRFFKETIANNYNFDVKISQDSSGFVGVPWIGIKSKKYQYFSRDFYIVYYLNGEEVYLAIDQGRSKTDDNILSQRAKKLSKDIYSSLFKLNPYIETDEVENNILNELTKYYKTSIIGKFYQYYELHEKYLKNDLKEAIEIYENLIPKYDGLISNNEKHKRIDSNNNYNNNNNLGKCPQCGKDLLIKNGKFGQFVGCKGFPKCKFTKDI
jgi:hypothetical protein